MTVTRSDPTELAILPQPNDTTCGPTCLHAVYRFYGDDISLEQVIAEVRPLPTGGTLAVWLACHALMRGYRAQIYTYNLQLFDPSWFAPGVDIGDKLRAQKLLKTSKRLALATDAYLEFQKLGGELCYEELRGTLIRSFLDRGIPILTGLSATYLYGCAREFNDHYDDVRGDPMGHFVLLRGHDRDKREVEVADPLANNPGFGTQYYVVGLDRLIGSILLGIVTYDANLLVITPRNAET
jgi:hypothetical protein